MIKIAICDDERELREATPPGCGNILLRRR